MMISKADFAELFPPVTPRTCRDTPAGPSDACVARWEDDGGAISPARLHHEKRPPRSAHYGFRGWCPKRAGIAAAMMPAMATYGATSAMLALYGQITTPP